MTFVLDASVTMAWCFLDQATRYTESAFDQLWQSQALVPTVWPLEVANVLLVAERGASLRRTRRASCVIYAPCPSSLMKAPRRLSTVPSWPAVAPMTCQPTTRPISSWRCGKVSPWRRWMIGCVVRRCEQGCFW